MAKEHERAPLCVGDYELGDATCDGDPDDPGDKPCGWRNRCAALQCFMKETDKPITDFVEHKVVTVEHIVQDAETGEDQVATAEAEFAFSKGPWKKFERLCDKQVERYGIRDGQVTRDPVGDPPPKTEKPPQPDRRKFLRPSKRAQRAAKKALSKRAGARRAALMKLFDHFAKHLADELKDTPYKFVRPDQALGWNMLYVVNRLQKSGYMSVYCYNPTGRSVALALAKFKPRDMTLDIMAPVAPGEFGKAVREKLAVQPVENGGLFKSVAMGLTREGVALAAETIAGMVRSGRIVLPGAAA